MTTWAWSAAQTLLRPQHSRIAARCIHAHHWTGRIQHDDKRGAIPANLPPVLERLNIGPPHWLFFTTKFESRLKSLAECAFKLKEAAEQLGYKRTPGLGLCKAVFS